MYGFLELHVARIMTITETPEQISNTKLQFERKEATSDDTVWKEGDLVRRKP